MREVNRFGHFYIGFTKCFANFGSSHFYEVPATCSQLKACHVEDVRAFGRGLFHPLLLGSGRLLEDLLQVFDLVNGVFLHRFLT